MTGLALDQVIDEIEVETVTNDFLRTPEQAGDFRRAPVALARADTNDGEMPARPAAVQRVDIIGGFGNGTGRPG